jgi:hypothetical protein
MGSFWFVPQLHSENDMFCTFHSSLPLVALLSPMNPFYPSHPITVRTILMLFYRPLFFFQSDSFLTYFIIKTSMYSSTLSYPLNSPLISSFLIWSSEWYLASCYTFAVTGQDKKASDAFNVTKTIKSVHIMLKIKETSSVQSSEDLTFILTIYKTYVPSSLWTHFVSITKIARSMLYRG